MFNISIPQATNNINSYGSFYQRLHYKDFVYPNGPTIPIPKDLWYEQKLYGRLDNKKNSIYPSEVFFKQFKQNEGSEIFFAINFVVDAFEDFRREFKLAASSNRIEEDSIFLNISVKSAWKNVNNLYHIYMKLLYESFTNSFLKGNNREKLITDFDSFVSIFIEFIDILTPNFPLSKTGFISSIYCDPSISGLIVHLADENHSIDQLKFEKYFNDLDYEFYIKTARKFGFSIDKNAPWRLIADVNSPAMFKYLNKYNIKNIDDLFNKSYYKTYNNDINIIKTYVYGFYNSFLKTNSVIENIKLTNNNKSFFEKLTRKEIDLANISDNMWVKLYLYVRCKENGLNLTKHEFDRLLTTSLNIKKSIDNNKMLDYINAKIISLS